jgi:hypothetical protein
MTAQWRKLLVINFSKECCPNATRRRQAIVVAFSDVACRGSFGRMRPVRGEHAITMSDQQTRLSGRKRGCGPLERSVVGDL